MDKLWCFFFHGDNYVCLHQILNKIFVFQIVKCVFALVLISRTIGLFGSSCKCQGITDILVGYKSNQRGCKELEYQGCFLPEGSPQVMSGFVVIVNGQGCNTICNRQTGGALF